MTSWVLDAGVAAKWFLPDEPLSGQATELLGAFRRGEVEFAVPDLFWSEFGNILWTAARQERISLAGASEAIAQLSSGFIPTVRSQELLRDAFLLAHAYGRTVYDCIYVTVAVQTGREMLTAYERLVNAIGSRFPVKWLGALNL